MDRLSKRGGREKLHGSQSRRGREKLQHSQVACLLWGERKGILKVCTVDRATNQGNAWWGWFVPVVIPPIPCQLTPGATKLFQFEESKKNAP